MNSEGIKNEVYVNDIYKLKGYSFQRLPKYVVDIEANVGWFSKLAAERFPKTNILAYELIEDNYKQCVKLNKPHSNVRVYNKAIIGNNSVKSVFLHPTNIGGHKPLFDGDSSYISEERFKETFRHHNKKDYDNREDLDIPSQISVKDIIEEHNIDYIDFLKLDCEGSEYEILPHIFQNNLDDKILNLAMEIHGINTPEYLSLLMQLKDKFDYYKQIGQIIYCKNYIKEDI